MFHSLNGFIGKESQFGNDSELVPLQRAELSADSSGIIGNLVHQFLFAIVGEDAQVDIGDAQVGRHTHLAHRDEYAAYLFGVSEEDVAEVLLYQSGDFVLTC